MLRPRSDALFTCLADVDPRLGLAWWTDPGMVGRLAFRPFDTASWTAGAIVDIDPAATVALSLAPGRGVAAGGGSYQGAGYALVWRAVAGEGEPMGQAHLAVIGLDGALELGPLAASAPAATPYPRPAAVWSGSSYLLASSYQDCPDGDPLCQPHSVVIARLELDAGGGQAALVPVDAAAMSGYDAPRVAMASSADRTWLAWVESYGPKQAEPQLRIAAVNPHGELLAAPLSPAIAGSPISSLTLAASHQGLALAWLDRGLPDAPPGEPGASSLVVAPLDPDGSPRDPPLWLPVTAAQPAPTAVAALADPRGLLVAWSGLSTSSDRQVVWLARLDCTPGR